MISAKQPQAPAYNVKRVESVLKTADVQARLFTLGPGEAIPWHYHEQSTDHYFVLEGVLLITTREPDILGKRILAGGSHKIAPGTPHLISNGGNTDCRFLLLQGVGTADWRPAG